MKLLQGQQLYISKHIHAQRLNEDIDKPPPAPPITRLNPCITKCSLGGVLLPDRYMYIKERGGAQRQFNGESLDESSFLFHNIPDLLRDAYVHVGDLDHLERTGQNLHTFLQAAQLHWLKCSTTFGVTLRADGMYGEYVLYNINDWLAYCTVIDDTYQAAETTPWGCSWGITITWLPNENGHEELRVPAYSFSPGYTMKVSWYLPGLYAVWSCHRNADGTYDPPTGIYA